VSLAHIDAVGYEQCIRNMVHEHKRYHRVEEDDVDSVNVDVYIMGGFDDADNASRPISNFLMNLLATIASDESDCLTLTLKTCAISCMNDDGTACPIGRGMGIDVETGECFLCKVDQSVAGPSPTLRSARLWSGHGGKALAVIHSIHSSDVCIHPFSYTPVAHTKVLLSLDDSDLLQYTSTSPDVEEDDFCYSVRSALTFMDAYSPELFFGPACHQPAVFYRVGNTNRWKQRAQF